MTAEQIRERLETLNKERADAVAMVHVLDGAIQDCEFWLALATKAEPEDEAPAP